MRRTVVGGGAVELLADDPQAAISTITAAMKARGGHGPSTTTPPSPRRTPGSAEGERRPALEVDPAGLPRHAQLEVDQPLTTLVAPADDSGMVGEHVAGPRLLAELHLEPAHVGRAQPL